MNEKKYDIKKSCHIAKNKIECKNMDTDVCRKCMYLK